MKICRKCKIIGFSFSKYCPSCGKKIEELTEKDFLILCKKIEKNIRT